MSALTTNPRLPSTWALYLGELRRQWTPRAIAWLLLAAILAAGVQLGFTWGLRPRLLEDGYRSTPRQKISHFLLVVDSPLYSQPAARTLDELELPPRSTSPAEPRLLTAYLFWLPLALFQLLSPAYAAVAFARFRRDDGEIYARQGYSAEQVVLGTGLAALTPLAAGLLGSIIAAYYLTTSGASPPGPYPLPATGVGLRLATSAIVNGVLFVCISGSTSRTWGALAACYAFSFTVWPLAAYACALHDTVGWQVLWGYADRLDEWWNLVGLQVLAALILAFPSVLHIQSRLEAACSASVE